MQKCRLWSVQYTYKEQPTHWYNRNGELFVFAHTFDDAAETVKSQFNDVHPDCIDLKVMGVQHRGEKTFLWSSTAIQEM